MLAIKFKQIMLNFEKKNLFNPYSLLESTNTINAQLSDESNSLTQLKLKSSYIIKQSAV